MHSPIRLGHPQCSSPRSTVAFLVLLFLMSCALYWLYESSSIHPQRRSSFATDPKNNQTPSVNFYVISLANRTDRRLNMETLRHELGLEWIYMQAITPDDFIIDSIFERVRFARSRIANLTDRDKHGRIHRGQPFRWPRNLERIAHTARPLSLQASKFWATTASDVPSSLTNLSSSGNSNPFRPSYQPLTCATGNQDIPPYKSDLPPYKILTPARVACWHSHLSVLQHIANENGGQAISVILEDDIDIERDIQGRLNWLWSVIPTDWDVVFLGHCWSDETVYPPINGPLYQQGTWRDDMRLHPSSAPECTHAYAINRLGARRLLLHLLYPPFAYSRAIDQAYAWLIQTKRLASYSVVPSIVVQRKTDKSDVAGGIGSGWREGLVNGVFGDSTDDVVFLD